MEAMLPDTDDATAPMSIMESGATSVSLAMGSRYALNQFQHAPASGSPGHFGGSAFHLHAPRCRSAMQFTPACPVPACPQTCCSLAQIASNAASASACVD